MKWIALVLLTGCQITTGCAMDHAPALGVLSGDALGAGAAGSAAVWPEDASVTNGQAPEADKPQESAANNIPENIPEVDEPEEPEQAPAQLPAAPLPVLPAPAAPEPPPMVPEDPEPIEQAPPDRPPEPAASMSWRDPAPEECPWSSSCVSGRCWNQTGGDFVIFETGACGAGCPDYNTREDGLIVHWAQECRAGQCVVVCD